MPPWTQPNLCRAREEQCKNKCIADLRSLVDQSRNLACQLHLKCCREPLTIITADQEACTSANVAPKADPYISIGTELTQFFLSNLTDWKKDNSLLQNVSALLPVKFFAFLG